MRIVRLLAVIMVLLGAPLSVGTAVAGTTTEGRVATTAPAEAAQGAPAATTQAAPATTTQAVTTQAAPATSTPAAQAASGEPLFYVGMSGMGVSDIDLNDPQIRSTFSNLGMANLTARTATALTCRNEAWMSLVVPGDVIDSEGRDTRGDGRGQCPYFSVTDNGTSARVNYFDRMTSEVTWPAENPFGPDALAIGPGAAIATADETGVSHNWRALPNSADELLPLLQDATGPVLIDIGGVRAPRGGDGRDLQVNSVNGRLSMVLDAYERAGSPGRLVIASAGDTWRSLQLQVYATEFPGESGPGIIHTTTTRADGLVTIANLRDAVAGGDSTTTLVPTDTVDDAVVQLTDMEDQVYAAGRSTATWYQVFNILGIVGILGTIAVFFLRATNTRLWSALATLNLFTFSFVPAALILNFIPWWRLVADASPLVTSIVAIGLTALLAGLLTFLAKLTKHPVAVVAIVAFVVLGADIVMGSAHQRNGFMGSLVMTSRRYYGISNRTYLILVVAGLLATLPWVRRFSAQSRAKAAWGVAGVGLIALLVDAVPMWGADFGGPPGIIAGFGIAAIMVAGLRFRWWYLLVWLALTGGTMGIIAFIDSRSSAGSHIGSFWQGLGTDSSLALIQSKISDVVRSFVGRPDILILLVVVIAVVIGSIVLLRRLSASGSRHVDLLRYAVSEPGTTAVLAGIVAAILIAVPINDSGALMIKEGIYIAVPAICALLAGRLAGLTPAELENMGGTASSGDAEPTRDSEKVL